MSDHNTGDDPINELSRFGDDFSNRTGGDMPLSAAAVRRRGDQIRRRRTALVAGASALAVAAVAVPIFAVVNGNPKADDHNDVANDKLNSRSLSVEDLITDDDTVYNEGSDWVATGTFEYDGELREPFHMCAREDLFVGLGAEAAFSREFALEPTDPDPADVPDPIASLDNFRETIAQFPDAATATAAYDKISAWLVDCKEQLAGTDITEYDEKNSYPVETGLGEDSIAQIIDAHYGPVPTEVDPTGDFGFIAETGLVRVGNRIAVLASAVVAMDYNFLDEDGGTPVNQMIPAAAERLQPGADEPANPTTTEPPNETAGIDDPATPDGSAPSINPAIAEDFPLAAGWPEADGDETKLLGPDRTLAPFEFNVCDVLTPVRQPIDRLKTEWSQPEDYRTRQLSTYATEDEATQALDDIVQAYRSCPEEPPSQEGTTRHNLAVDGSVGDQSMIVGSHFSYQGQPTIGLDIIYLVRVGTALLFISAGNEGTATDPEADFTGRGAEMAADASDVIGEMCVFSEARC